MIDKRARLVASAAAALIVASLAPWPSALAQQAGSRGHHLPAPPGFSLVPAHPVSAGGPAAPQPSVVTSRPAPVWPAAGAADVDLPGTALARAGSLPVQVASPVAGRAHVQVFDHATAQKAGVSGFMFQVSRADGAGQSAPTTARLDYSGFARAYGGGFASRLRVVALPACAATTPERPDCQRATPLAAANDLDTHALTVSLSAQPDPRAVTLMDSTSTVLAVTSGTSGGSGDFKATSLTPAGTWDVGLQTGDFTWSYPLPARPPIAGTAPALALAYDSGSTDGETAQSNSQTSQVGEGFELAGGGYVERKYKACADEMSTAASKTGDLCWGNDNAYLALDGRATEVVKDDASGTWHLKDDEGSRVELLTLASGASNGDDYKQYWKVTTVDGTLYFFGLNQLPGFASGQAVTNSAWTVPVVSYKSSDPGHGSDYAASTHNRAWRWNLDLVVDPNGNAREYFYTPETNSYLFDSTGATPGSARSYTRGGFLSEVGYSSQAANVYAHIPMRVMLTPGDRCLAGSSCTTHSSQNWPDTPWDLSCAGSGCGAASHEAPSFWTTKMLTGVSTQVWEGSAGYVTVDSWSLGHQFLSADVDDLWLSSITHTGHVGGSAQLPSVTIGGTSSVNRVAGDGYSPMYRYRVTSINSESGEQTAVTYNGANCGSSRPSPSTDILPCFQQWWTPGDPQDNIAPVESWFYKYPVQQVAVHDNTGGSLDDQVISYKYGTDAAWHYDNDDGLVPDKYKSYAQWRGFETVSVITGSSTETQSEKDYRFMQGMDGDHLPGGATRTVTVTDSERTSIPDSERLNGFSREEITRLGPGGPEVSGRILDPWQSQPTASSVKSWGTMTAKLDGVAAAHDRVALASGGYRRTEVDNTFDVHGLITQTNDLGDIGTTSDQLCTTNSYAQNTSAWLLDAIDEQTVHAAACGTSGAPLVSDTRHLYDGGAFGAAPVHGNVTETDHWSAGDPGIADHWVAAERDGYDSLGRVTSSKDAAGNTTTTSYSSAYGAGNATTQEVVTNALGFAATTDLEPGRGVPADTIDPNGERMDLTYDPLGRLTAVWQPGQSKAAGAKPNLTFSYQTGATTPPAVTTNRLINPSTGLYVTTVAIYDGLLRPRQTQRVAEAVSGAMLVTDTLYDSRGEVVTLNAPYAVSGTPSGTLFGVSQSQVPSYTLSTYDGAGRKTADALYSMGTFQQQTTYTHGGDRTTSTPPQGGTVTTTVTDARGRLAETDQYQGSSASGTFDATVHSYTPAGQEATVTDVAGNKWTNVYDLLGRRIQASDPDTGTTTSVYDDLDRLVATTDARGRTTSTTYDALGRRTAEYDTTGGAAQSAATQTAAWTYDSIVGAEGHPVSSTRFSGGAAYTETVTGYDGAYRPTGTQVVIPNTEGALGRTYSFGASYNVDGTLSSESFQDAVGGLPAETVNHMYDNLGQPDSTWGSGTSDYVERTLWTPDLKPAAYDLGTNQNASWSALNFSYDVPTRRLAEITVQRESNNWANDADFKYAYDDAGNVTSASETVAGDYQCFTYDYLRRLTQAWAQGAGGCSSTPTASTIGGPSPYLEQFAYDLTGNRTTDTITYGVNNYVGYTNSFPAAATAQPHTLTSQNVVSTAYGYWTDTRTYDPSGNTLTVTTPHSSQALTWNDQGKLASVADSANGHSTTYVYNADGGLLLRHDDSTATLYLPGEELTASGSTVTGTRYYTHNGATVAVRTQSGVNWLASDPRDTASVMIDASSQKVTQRRFTPFGAPRSPLPSSWPGDKGFVGGIVDSTTAFTNLGAREYDPITGRFLSADPLLLTGDPQQMNGYAYANNSPITEADPTGLCFGDVHERCYTPRPPPPPPPPGGDVGCGTCDAVPSYYHQYPAYNPLGYMLPAPAKPKPPPHPAQAAVGLSGCFLPGRGGFEMGCRTATGPTGGGGWPTWLADIGHGVAWWESHAWHHIFVQGSLCFLTCVSLTLQGGHFILGWTEFGSGWRFPKWFAGGGVGVSAGTEKDRLRDNIAGGIQVGDGLAGGVGGSIHQGSRGLGSLHPYLEIGGGTGVMVDAGSSRSIDLNHAVPAAIDHLLDAFDCPSGGQSCWGHPR